MSWRCYFCDTNNTDDDNVCVNCDHTRAESDIKNAEYEEAEARRISASGSSSDSSSGTSAHGDSSGMSDFDRLFSELEGVASRLSDEYAEELRSSGVEDEEEAVPTPEPARRRRRVRRPAVRRPYVEERYAPVSGEDTPRSRRRFSFSMPTITLSYTAKKVLNAIFAVVVVVGSFLLGQFISTYYVDKNGKTFTVDKFFRLCHVHFENQNKLITLITLAGFVAVIFMLYITVRCAVKGDFRELWLIAAPFGVAAIVLPDTYMLIAPILGLIAVFFKRRLFVPAIIIAIISLGSIPAILCATFCTPDVYVVTLHYSLDEEDDYIIDTLFVREGDDMPEISIPVDEYKLYYGYCDEEGKRYYDEDGAPLRKWDENEDKNLYVIWRWKRTNKILPDSPDLTVSFFTGYLNRTVTF